MSNPIILPNITLIDEFDPISAGPAILNANFVDLSAYSTVLSAGLIQLAEFDDTLQPVPSQQLALSPYVLNERLSATFDLVPAIGGIYNIGSIGLPYNNVFGTQLILSGATISVSGTTLLLNGIPVQDPDAVGTHNLDDVSVHTNIDGTPSNHETFRYDSTASTWDYVSFPFFGSEAPAAVIGQTITFSGTGDTAGWYPTSDPGGTLEDLNDTVFTNPVPGESLIYNGNDWENSSVNIFATTNVYEATEITSVSGLATANVTDVYTMAQLDEALGYKESIESLQSVYIKYTITPIAAGSPIDAKISVKLFASSTDLSGDPIITEVVVGSYLNTVTSNETIENMAIVPLTFRDEVLEITSTFNNSNATITYEMIGAGFSRQGDFSPSISHDFFGGQVSGAGLFNTSGFIDSTTNTDLSGSLSGTIYNLYGDVQPAAKWDIDILPLRISKKTTQTSFNYKSFRDVSVGSIQFELSIKIDWLSLEGKGTYLNHQNGDFGSLDISGGFLSLTDILGNIPNFQMQIVRDVDSNIIFSLPKDDNSDFHTYELNHINVNNNTLKTVRDITTDTTISASNRYIRTNSNITLPQIDAVVDEKLISVFSYSAIPITISADGTSSIVGATSIGENEFSEYIADVSSDSWIQIK